MNRTPTDHYVAIPTCTFLMGTPEADLSRLAQEYSGTRESYREESPQHSVTVDAFSIGQTPITVALYAAYVTAGGVAPLSWQSQQSRDTQLPVVDITQHMAYGYAEWRSSSADALYRLPTEAEWECAARGQDGRQFPWGNDWHVTHANSREAGTPLLPVGSYPSGASPWGVLDMAGTVWEWTSSLDVLYPYDADDGRNNPLTPGRRVIRGGCYVNPIGYARCACRFRMAPDRTNAFLGFRLVKEHRNAR